MIVPGAAPFDKGIRRRRLDRGIGGIRACQNRHVTGGDGDIAAASGELRRAFENRDPQRLIELRQKLARNREAAVLFDLPKLTGNIEAAYLRMWQTWLAGREPWRSSKHLDRQRYFKAGGNGVAMRIMPHCLIDVFEPDFGKIAKHIVANGVATH